MTQELDRLQIRDCFAQARAVRRLIAQLADDLGDCSMMTADAEMSAFFEQATGVASDAENKLSELQDQLAVLSRK